MPNVHLNQKVPKPPEDTTYDTWFRFRMAVIPYPGGGTHQKCPKPELATGTAIAMAGWVALPLHVYTTHSLDLGPT